MEEEASENWRNYANLLDSVDEMPRQLLKDVRINDLAFRKTNAKTPQDHHERTDNALRLLALAKNEKGPGDGEDDGQFENRTDVSDQAQANRGEAKDWRDTGNSMAIL